MNFPLITRRRHKAELSKLRSEYMGYINSWWERSLVHGEREEELMNTIMMMSRQGYEVELTPTALDR